MNLVKTIASLAGSSQMTKILYVEDNPDNIYMLTRRLKKKGFDIIIAGDGQEGIDKAIEESTRSYFNGLKFANNGWLDCYGKN